MDGWINPFYVLFYSISVISGQWQDDDNRLNAMKLTLGLGRNFVLYM